MTTRVRQVVDVLFVGTLIVILTGVHYTFYEHAVNFHIILQFGYYLPVIYAAMRFGPLGGMGTGLLITLLFLPHLAYFRLLDPPTWYTQWVEIILINGIGWLTGFLIQQERRATSELQEAFRKEEELVQQLQAESRQREKLESEIRQTERLTALGHLSAGLAHEIRNPLGIIQATVQLLAQERVGDQDVAEYCEVLLQECGRLNRLVSEFLSFARPKEPIRQEVRFDDLVNEGVSLLEPYLRQHRLSLQRNLGPAASLVVAADLDQMKQVILNVLLNAAEAQGNGGEIILEGRIESGFVGVAVLDAGPGFSNEVLPYIYDPFFTTKDKGTGLGLSVVHRILEQHGGRIMAANRPEGGAQVVIWLPVGSKPPVGLCQTSGG